MTAPAAAPLSLRHLVDETRALLESNPLQLLLPLVILGILTSSDGRASPWNGRVDFDGGIDGFVLLPFLAFAGLLVLAVLILVFLAYALATLVTTDVALGRLRGGAAADLSTSFANTKPHFWSAVGTFLLYALVVVVGFVLLIVPGLFAIAALLPIAPVVVAERRTGTDALRRAWDLTEGHRGTLFLLVLLYVAGCIVAAIIGMLPLIGTVLAGALNGALSAALLVAGVVFYHHRTPAPDAPPVVATPAVL